MTKTEKEWREEFDREFNYIGKALDAYTTNTYTEVKKSGNEHLEDIKAFIQKTLTNPIEGKECKHEWICAKEGWQYRDFFCSKCLANITYSRGEWSKVIKK